MINVSRTNRVDLELEYQRDVVCQLFAFLCSAFLGAAPLSYEQAAILNLPHSCKKCWQCKCYKAVQKWLQMISYTPANVQINPPTR